jgi:hypothetical protein
MMPRSQMDDIPQIRDPFSSGKNVIGPDRDIDWQRRFEDVHTGIGPMQGNEWQRRSDEDVHTADFDWSKRQETDSSDSDSSHRQGHPDGFIMVDRSASPEITASDGRNMKPEESDIVWGVLPKEDTGPDRDFDWHR